MARRPSTPEGKARYAKRLANATAKGKTRQEARGHKPGEAKRRRERETATGGLTSKQRSEVRAFAAQQADRVGRDPDRASAAMLSWATRRGWDQFKQLRAQQRIGAKLKLMPKGWLENMVADLGGDDDDPPDLYWLYYN